MILSRILDEHLYWLRLATLIEYFRESLYNDILHRSCKLAVNPTKLYSVLEKERRKFDQLLRRQKISDRQYNLIFPASKQTQISKFDIQTFVFVVRYCTKLKPKGGWVLARHLKRGDRSKAALLLELEYYIQENMEGIEAIMLPRFLEDWDDLVYLFKGLKMNVEESNDLKTCKINNIIIPIKFVPAVMKAQIDFVRNDQKLKTTQIQTLQLEDEDNANSVDITNLINQNLKIEMLINNLYDSITTDDVSWNDIYNGLVDIDAYLVELKGNIDFLKQVVIMDCQPSFNHDDDSDEDAESLFEEKVKLSIRKLKASHAFSLSNDHHLKQNDCCLQPYTMLELLGHSKQGDVIKEEHIDLRDLFSHNSHILVKGISGIGKTYMVREIMKEWMHGCIFEDIKFLFVLKYQDVKNTVCESLEELLKLLFPHVFQEITLADILSKPNQMLIIFDGWGQLSGLDYTQQNRRNGIAMYAAFEISKWFFEALDSENGILLAQRTIITTRPDSYDLLRERIINCNIAEVDVLGFSRENIHVYVLRFFKDKNELFELVKHNIEEDENLRQLLQIPLYLWMFCFIHYRNSSFDNLKTRTEFYLWKLAILLNKNHQDVEMNETIEEINREMKKESNEEEILTENVTETTSNTDESDRESVEKHEIDFHLFDNGVATTSILETAQLSYKAKMGGYINRDYFNDHTMPEYLASIYLFILNKCPLEIKQDYRIRECLSFVSGLQGIATMSQLSLPSLTTSFVENLNVLYNRDFINQLFLTYLQQNKQQTECTIKNEFLPFLESYFEFQGFLVENEEFKETKLNIELKNLLPIELTNLIYFLQREHYQLHIQSLYLHTYSPITKRQMEGISPHILNISSVKIDIKSFGESSDILSKTFQSYRNTKEFNVKIKELELTQACEYETDMDINLNWLVYIKKFHLKLTVTDASIYFTNLRQIIPKALNSYNGYMKLKCLKLSIMANHGLFQTLTALLTNLIYLKEIEIIVNWQDNKNIASRQQDESKTNNNNMMMTHEEEVLTEFSSIKYALFKALFDNTIPRNLKRLVIRDKLCSYEFNIDKKQQITIVSDKEEEEFIDVDLMSF